MRYEVDTKVGITAYSYHFNELELTNMDKIAYNNGRISKKQLRSALRYGCYVNAPFHLKSIRLDKESCKEVIRYRYELTFEQNESGIRTEEQVAMENERFHRAEQLSINSSDLNEVYANLDFLEGKSI